MSMVRPRPMPPKPDRPPKRGTTEWIQKKRAEARARFSSRLAKDRATRSATPSKQKKRWRERSASRKRLPARSERRKRLDVIYTVLRLLFLRRHPFCEACALLDPERKPRRATEVHHVSGRGKFYLAIWTWLAVCLWCHRWITDNGKAAEAKGLIVRVYEKH